MYKILPVILILVFLGVDSQAQVLGIDFGTQFWKAALISPGKNLVIVQNSRSQRKTLNGIAFQDGIRYFEEDAHSKRVKKPHLTYTFLNKLIYSLDSSIAVDGYKLNDGTYIFDNTDQDMTLQQVVAMILGNIKQHASHQAGTQIRDVVLTVPANWGFKAKMSLVNAAHLAQLSVLGLINQNSAASIHYAITRNDTQPLNIMFFNLGSHNLQISIIKMFGHYDQSKNKTIQGIEALAHFVKQDVGGLNIDKAISQYLAKQFNKKHKIDPTANKKSLTKLLVKSSDVKQTLSANKDMQVYIQGLIDGIDLVLPINRKIIDQHEGFNDFSNYLTQVLEQANLGKDDIAAVELIGGASRIPKVSSVVKQYFPDIEVGAHINGDEAMAFGSALRAANLSLTFRVKQLFFNDPMNLDTKLVVSTSDKGVIAEQQLFTLNDHHGARKIVTIPQNKQDVKLTVYVGDEIVKQFVTKSISDWQTKYKDQNITNQPQLTVDFMMNSVHIAEIKDIYLNITLNVTSMEMKVEYVDEVVEVDVQVKLNQTQKAEQKTEQKGQQQEKKDEQKKPKTEKKNITKTKTVKNLVQTHKIENKKHIMSFEQIFAKYKKFTKQQTDDKTKLIISYDKYEKELRQKSKLRNDFQSALYNLKNNFDDPNLKKFSKKQQLEQLKQTVATQLQWMDENAWSAEKSQLQDHFKILSGVYEPIYNRTQQYRNRQKTYNETISYFSTVFKKTTQLITSHPWVSEQATRLLKKVNDTVDELNTKLKKVIEQPLHENPQIYNGQMISMAQKLRDQYYILRLIPRPKIDSKQKSKQQQKPADEDKQKAEQNDQTQQEADSDGQDEEQDNNQGDSEDESEDDSNKRKEDL